MEKMNMHSLNIISENVKKIGDFFPNCITEVIDTNGKLIRAVDFDLLKQELSTEIVEGQQERYQINWPGKRQALLTANSPIAKTLRPIVSESLNFENTKNVFIEGDNLDALKLLQGSYLNKVKMIYIDPPYNTGSDFVYRDNFSTSSDQYLKESNQVDDTLNRLIVNPETEGRFHSIWLSMMYSRLKLSRNLLKDDGVIFVSIDEDEFTNLKKICDEIFGEINFIAIISREAIKGGSKSADIRKVNDFVLCYAKNKHQVKFEGFEKDPIVLDLEDSHGPYKKGRELNKWGAGSRREDSPGMFFSIKGPNGEDVFPIRNDGTEGRWRLGKAKMGEKARNGDIIFEPRGDGTFICYEKIRAAQSNSFKQLTTLFLDNYTNASGTEAFKDLFKIERSYFDYVKPVELIHDLMILVGCKDNDIVMDYFAGSGTTGQAIMKYNLEQNRNVKFILIQIAEKPKKDSEADKAGFENIAKITVERLRKSSSLVESLLADSEREEPVDSGFRFFRIGQSCMKDVYYKPDDLSQKALFEHISNIREGSTSEDLIFQVLLDWGLELSLNIKKQAILDKNVYFVDETSLVACFEDEVGEELVHEIAEIKPYRVIFKEIGFANDSIKINTEQIFKLKSPETEIKTI